MKKQVTLASIALASAIISGSAYADDLQVSGKVFYDYSAHASTGSPDTTGGTIGRTYISAKKKIDNIWSAKVTLDSALNKTHDSKRNEVFLKTAQLTGKFSKALNVKLGMIGTPWVGYEDKLGKHRHVSKSFVDTHKMAASADAGIGVFGKAMKGMISYDIASINGGGYGKTNITAKSDIEVRVGAQPIEGLTVDFGYRDGYLGKFDATNKEDKTTLTQFLITYGATMGEISYRAGFNTISNAINDQLAATTLNQSGTEIWAWARKGQFGGYFRNESFDNGVAGDAVEKRTVLGLDYYATKGVIVSLVSDSISDSGNNAGDKKSKTGVFTQFKF